jgi:GT2 family glycosyltransferase
VTAALPDHARLIAGAAGAPAGDYDADIIILALDRAAETVAAIRSALQQTGTTRHVFIVDQGSAPEALAEIAGAVTDRADATLIALDRNYGVGGGRNIASGLGHGRVIAALDNDAEFADAGTLARAVGAIDADPALAAIGFRIVEFASGVDDLSSWGYPLALLPRAGESFDAVTFVGAGHAIRRRAWDEAGGYDARLFFTWEEYAFCLHAIDRGWRIRYRGDLVVRHKVSAQQRVVWSVTRWFHFVRNRIYIERSWNRSWIALAPRIGGYLVKGARHHLLGATLRAIGAASRMQATRQTMSAGGRAYLRANDRAHRGGWTTRLRGEVLAALPGK